MPTNYDVFRSRAASQMHRLVRKRLGIHDLLLGWQYLLLRLVPVPKESQVNW